MRGLRSRNVYGSNLLNGALSRWGLNKGRQKGLMRQRTRLQYKYDQQHKYNEIILHDIITNRSVKNFYIIIIENVWGNCRDMIIQLLRLERNLTFRVEKLQNSMFLIL